MHRDPTLFRNRFKMWKDGKDVYEAGRATEVVITPDYEYNLFLNTLPDNQRFTPELKYTTHRYWELNDKPKNFSQAIQKGMYTLEPDGWHASSILENRKTGEIEFMKPWNHPSIGLEYDWYTSSDPEAVEFRKKYKHVPSVPNAKYVPRFKNGKDSLPKFYEGEDAVQWKDLEHTRFTSPETRRFENMFVTPSGVKYKDAYQMRPEWNDGEFVSTLLMPTSLLSPTHVGRALYNLFTGTGYDSFAKNMFMPNSGIVSNQFASEHPWLSMSYHDFYKEDTDNEV